MAYPVDSKTTTDLNATQTVMRTVPMHIKYRNFSTRAVPSTSCLQSKILTNNDVMFAYGATTRSTNTESDILFETDRLVLEGVPIRAATLPALVRLLVDAFDDDGKIIADAESLPKVVLLMHRWFITSAGMAQYLFALHSTAHSVIPCSLAFCEHVEENKCVVFKYQTRVCHAIRFWIMHFPMQINLESGLSSSLKEFQSRLTTPLAKLVDQSQVPSYDWMRHVSVRDVDHAQTLKVSLVLNQLEPMELAEQITYLEHKVMRRISFHDYKKYAETGSLSQTARLEHSVALFNGLTQWIQCMVLSHTKQQQRADVINKFIHIAQKLLELQNFNSLMAVVGSLSHSVLARLSKTMACLAIESKKTLAELVELLSSSHNFSNYRRALSQCSGFKIPILGIHLKDLIALNVALPDRVQGDMINVRKIAQLSPIFHELEELQKSAPPMEANMDLINTLRLSLDLAYTDNEIYELSLEREPRYTNSDKCLQRKIGEAIELEKRPFDLNSRDDSSKLPPAWKPALSKYRVEEKDASDEITKRARFPVPKEDKRRKKVVNLSTISVPITRSRA